MLWKSKKSISLKYQIVFLSLENLDNNYDDDDDVDVKINRACESIRECSAT
jgi:hypothetical protein